MSSTREIPGFYYDAERNRYFRIQPDHKLPTGTAHSQSAVKASKEVEKARNVRRKREDRERKGQVRRLDSASYTSLSLALRLGQSQNKILNHLSQNYAARLVPSSATLVERRRLQAFELTPGGQLYAMVSSTDGVAPFSVFHSNAQEKPYYMIPPHVSPGPRWGAMMSVGGQYLLSATGPAVSISSLHGAHGTLSSVQIRFDSTIWDMAASPTSNSLCAALATETGLRVGEAPFHHDVPSILCPGQLSEQVTVTFKDPNVIMSGERSGIVNFTDIRVSSTVRRLQHSSGVNGTSMGRNTNHVLVSGLGTVALYDLRYTKAAVPNRKRGRSQKHIGLIPSTKPLVPFYVPTASRTIQYTQGKTLLYIPYLDIAVVASQHAAHGYSTSTGTVLLYNASNGQLLKSPLSDCHFGSFTGLAAGRVRDGPESIFVGTETELYEFSIDLPNPKDRTHADRVGNTELQISGVGPHGPRTFGQAVYELERQRFPVDPELQVAEFWRNGDRGPV